MNYKIIVFPLMSILLAFSFVSCVAPQADNSSSFKASSVPSSQLDLKSVEKKLADIQEEVAAVEEKLANQKGQPVSNDPEAQKHLDELQAEWERLDQIWKEEAARGSNHFSSSKS